MYVNLPLVPNEEGAEARPVDPAVPLAVVFPDGSPVDATVVVLPETLVETTVPMVPVGSGV